MIIPRRLPLCAILSAGLAAGALQAQTNSQFSLNVGTGAADASKHQTPNPTWKLVWSDEFTGSSLDTSKWSYEVNGDGGGNGELEYYTDSPKNTSVSGGNLVITGIKETYKGKPFTSARITTKGKFSWLYGRMEARIKVPIGGKGVWPAFWLMPEDSKYGGWAKSGEIDIMEMVGHQANTLYGTLHYHDSWPRNKHTGDKLVLPSGVLGDDFHTYAVEWEPGEIRWYFDNKLYETQTKWDTVSAPFPAPFNQNFFIILNFAIGGAWPGKPTASTQFPQTMTVDYVRVYQPAGGFPNQPPAAPAEAPAPAAAAEPAAPASAPAAAPAPAAADDTAAPPAGVSAGKPAVANLQPDPAPSDDGNSSSDSSSDSDSSATPGSPIQPMSPAGKSW